MNNGTLELPQSDRGTSITRKSRPSANLDELSQLKRELLQAAVRVAKARATIAGAEVDIKVLTARLKALAR